MTTIDEQAQQLREKLRNGRTAKAGTDASSNGDDHDSASGPSYENVRRDFGIEQGSSNQTTGIDRQLPDNDASTGKKPRGLGKSTGRPGQDSSGFVTDTTRGRSIGLMEPDGPVPVRHLEPDSPQATFTKDDSLLGKYPSAASILALNPQISSRTLGKELGISHDTANKIKKEWEETHSKPVAPPEKVPFFGKGNTLNKAEIEEYSESLPSALEDIFQATDDWLWKRQIAAGKDSDEQPVWTNLDDKEMSRLTKVFLKWGQKSGMGAGAVRGIVESSDYIAVGSMLAPRFMQTVDIYRETRRPRQRRGYASQD